MCNLSVKVFANENNLANNRRLFERLIEVHDSCEIPYETITRALKFFYGSAIIIAFTLYCK